jgi:hypothetical protein
VANSTTGKWVSRVGSSGGGKAYRRSRPVNYYGIVAVIVVLGLSSVVYARYSYQHPKKTAVVQPAIGTKWFVSLASEVCGVAQPFFTSDTTYTGGYIVEANNVLQVDPTVKSEAGKNATLTKFASEFAGLSITSTKLALPNAVGVASKATTFTNGETCPSTSKYKGQKGIVKIAYWKNLAQNKPTITTNPSSVRFTQAMRVTLAFDPVGVTPGAPASTTVSTMVNYEANPPSSTTNTTTVTSTSIVKHITITTNTTPATTATTKPTTTTTSATTTTTGG